MRIAIVGMVLLGLLAVAVVGQEPPTPIKPEVPVTPVPGPIVLPKVVPAPDDSHRLVWENSAWQCQYVDKGDDKWVEIDRATGAVSFRFKETRRNCDFVELLDQERGYTVRLYKDALFIKGGNDGLARHEDFMKLGVTQ